MKSTNYIIRWYFEASGSDGNAYYGYRVQCDDTTDIMEIKIAIINQLQEEAEQERKD